MPPFEDQISKDSLSGKETNRGALFADSYGVPSKAFDVLKNVAAGATTRDAIKFPDAEMPVVKAVDGVKVRDAAVKNGDRPQGLETFSRLGGVLPRGSVVSEELTGTKYRNSAAENAAMQLIDNMLPAPGAAFMNLDNMELSRLIAQGLDANSGQFVDYLQKALRSVWPNASVGLGQTDVPRNPPTSALGPTRHYHLEINGISNQPVRIPYGRR